MSEILLFVYGELRPDCNPPKTMSKYEIDHVIGVQGYDETTGEIYLVPHLLAVDERDYIEGYVVTIDENELPELDEYEGENYSRTYVLTKSGRLVQTYVRK